MVETSFEHHSLHELGYGGCPEPAAVNVKTAASQPSRETVPDHSHWFPRLPRSVVYTHVTTRYSLFGSRPDNVAEAGFTRTEPR
jgi:hypothetical protein